MGLFKARTGDAATLPKPNFSHQQEPAHSGSPIHAASEEGPQKWPDENRSCYESSHKLASPAPSPRPATTESAPSPRQQHGPYLSPGLDATSAAGRLTQLDQSGYTSRSTEHISLEPSATTTKPLEGRSYRQYHIPIPRKVPSPVAPSHNPMSASTSLAPPFPRGDDTTAVIGMALGSPNHPPVCVDAQWHTQTLTTVTSGGDATEPAANPNGVSRSMSKRWNPFSRTKSKRTKPADGSLSRTLETDSKKSLDLGSRVHLVKHVDVMGSQKGSSVSLLKEPVPVVHEIPVPRDVVVPTREPPAPPPQLQSLLSIEIPTVEMERYSVMFGSILQKQHPLFPQLLQQSSLPPPPQESQEPQVAPKAQHPEPPQRPAPVPKPEQAKQKESESPRQRREPQGSPQKLQLFPQSRQSPQETQRPSLPDRRQVKVDKLNLPAAKQYRDGSVPYEIVVPRRSTSPSPSGSSPVAISTPEPAPANTNLPPRVSSRARSNTTTAVANFPNPAMNKAPSQTRKRTSSVSTPSRAQTLPADAEPMPERRDRLISKFHRKESLSEDINHKVTHSTESLVSVPTHAPPQPRSILKKPTAPPPPPPSNRSAEHIAPPKQHQSKPSESSTIRSDADEEVVEKALYEAVEISIARQISVSRQQRRMLVPLDRSASRRGANSPDAAAMINLGKNKRLVETRTAVPVLMHQANRTNFSHGGSRKSSRVVLEGA
ncbi:hypothetical protein HDV57DRAFT_447920 [Trichoderma longibrachiatum]